MNTERDKFLTEAMGECWHEGLEDAEYHYDNDNTYAQEVNAYHVICEVCGQHFYGNDYNTGENDARTNFSTWEGFGKLWEWAIKQEWWCMFFTTVSYNEAYDTFNIEPYVHPDRFADAVYAYLKEVER